MNEFIKKLIERLENEHERCINRYGIVGGNQPAATVKRCINVVEELAEEYNQDSTKDNQVKSKGDNIRSMNNREMAAFLQPFLTGYLTVDDVEKWLEEEVEG